MVPQGYPAVVVIMPENNWNVISTRGPSPGRQCGQEYRTIRAGVPPSLRRAAQARNRLDSGPNLSISP